MTQQTSELKTIYAEDTFDEDYMEYHHSDKRYYREVYLKSEADNVIAELKEKLKVQTSIAEEGWKESGTYHTSYAEAVKELYDKNKEIAELKEIDSKNRSAYYKDLAMMAKDVERQKYNRCLLRSVIAEMNATHFKDLFYGAGSEALADEYNKQVTIHYKWQKRWLALAEKFKEAK